MQISAFQFIIVCPLVFVAGFMDAVAGGGGIISLPAYMLAGLPAHFATGTNKSVNTFGTIIASIKYLKEKKVYRQCALVAAIGSFSGSFLGTRIAIWIPGSLLQLLITVILPVVAVFLMLNKNFGKVTVPKEYSVTKTNVISLMIGFAIGLYDGIIGPGTGTFLIMAFTGFLGWDLLYSSGTAKVTNVASNVASTILYVINGKVVWMLFFPAVACNMLGNYLGAIYAIKEGSGKIRYMMFVVLALLIGKTVYEMIF